MKQKTVCWIIAGVMAILILALLPSLSQAAPVSGGGLTLEAVTALDGDVASDFYTITNTNKSISKTSTRTATVKLSDTTSLTTVITNTYTDSGIRTTPFTVSFPDSEFILGSLKINGVVQANPVITNNSFTLTLTYPAATTIPTQTAVEAKYRLNLQ